MVLGSVPSASAAAVADGGSIVAVRPGAALGDAFLPLEESRLLAMVNRERQVRGLPPLTLDASLRSAAREHSREMARRGYVGHGSSDGRSVRARMGRYVRPGARIGENVAFAQTVDQGHHAFMASPAHVLNMLDPAFRRVGIGVAYARDRRILITEDFASHD